MQHSKIIELFGGIRPMSVALDHKSPTTVQGWAKGKIPKWRYHEILQAAKKLKIKLSEADFDASKTNGKLRR